MRVAFVNSTHRWGGVKSWTMLVVRGLTARGHEVHLYLRADNPFARACEEEGFAVERMTFGPDWNPLAIARVTRGLRKKRCQVVVTNVSKDNRIGGPAARLAGVPVLMVVGGPGDLTDRRKIRFDLTHLVDHMVVPAVAVQESLRRLEWLPVDEMTTVIHNAVDVNRFQPGEGAGRLRQRLGLPPSVPIVASLSQLIPGKGLELMVRAFADLPQTDPPPHLVLIGRGVREPDLRALVARLGLEGRVHLPGFVEDLPLLLEDVAVGVHPSLQEGLPYSVLELMAKGKAVLATDVGGVPEAITDGKHGVLVPPDNEPALRNGMQRLLTQPDLRKRLGRAARRRVEQEFGEELLVDRLERLLHGITRQDD